MIKYILFICLLTGCVKKFDIEKAKSMASSFCACHEGLYFITPISKEFFLVNCNSGVKVTLRIEGFVKRLCK